MNNTRESTRNEISINLQFKTDCENLATFENFQYSKEKSEF